VGGIGQRDRFGFLQQVPNWEQKFREPRQLLIKSRLAWLPGPIVLGASVDMGTSALGLPGALPLHFCRVHSARVSPGRSRAPGCAEPHLSADPISVGRVAQHLRLGGATCVWSPPGAQVSCAGWRSPSSVPLPSASCDPLRGTLESRLGSVLGALLSCARGFSQIPETHSARPLGHRGFAGGTGGGIWAPEDPLTLGEDARHRRRRSKAESPPGWPRGDCISRGPEGRLRSAILVPHGHGAHRQQVAPRGPRLEESARLLALPGGQSPGCPWQARMRLQPAGVGAEGLQCAFNVPSGGGSLSPFQSFSITKQEGVC
jgi:hypothetical protein